MPNNLYVMRPLRPKRRKNAGEMTKGGDTIGRVEKILKIRLCGMARYVVAYAKINATTVPSSATTMPKINVSEMMPKSYAFLKILV